MFKKIFLFIILTGIYSLYAQTQIVLQDADYSREVLFVSQSGNYNTANALDTKPTITKSTYLGFGINTWFAFLQWTVTDNLIPDGSTINYVELTYSYSSDNTSYFHSLYYDDKDISDPNFSYSNSSEIYSNLIGTANNSGTVTINSNTYPSLKTVITSGLINNRVTFIVRRNDGIDIAGRVTSPQLTIHFTPPQQLVYVKQKYANGTEFGSVDLWETNTWEDEASGHQYSFGIGETEYLQAKTSIDNSQKFNNWNEDLSFKNFTNIYISDDLNDLTANFDGANNGTVKNSLESTSSYGGSIYLKDPWYRDDNSDSKATRNRGTSAIWHSSSIFNLTTASAYQGVFLGQGSPNWTPPYYTVKTTSPQTIYAQGKNRSFFFQNWESSGATFQNSGNLETPVVFSQAGATVKAVMKGNGLSNNSSTFIHNNQRKVVKTGNGNLQMVYESMGHIWYEMSTDDGDTWTIMNNGAPIDDSGDLSKSPSVTLDYNNTNYFFLVYQEVYLATDDNQVVVKRISETGAEVWTDNVDLVMSENSIDLEPVVACNYSNLLVVYRVEDNDIPGSSLGLNYTFYSRAGNPVVYTKQVIGGLVTGTSSTSVSPALASRQYPSSASMYYLAWKQGGNIQFTKIEVNNNSSLTFNTIETPTSGSGNSKNYSPSITANGSYVYLVWRGRKKEYSGGSASKVTAGGGSYVYVNRVNYRMRDYYGNWGTLKRYGSDVINPSINSAGSDYMYCWSENSGSTNKFVSSDNTTVEYFSTDGEDLQAGNGLNNSGQMQAVSFNKTTLPYNFTPTALLSDIGLDKAESIVMKYGREGIVSVDGAEFTFTIGDVLLDGEPIDFVSVTDSTIAENLTELNSYLKTNSFNITSGSELMVSVMFGVVDDSLAKIKLTEEDYVNFKMELVDSETEEVIGSFDNVTFTKENVEQYANISYLLETDGIGNKKVELRLVVDENIGASYSLARLYSDKEVLTKSISKVTSYQGSLEVKEYALSQNYPNPFNPSTTINYQIPADGFVSLKIYDITGSEVTTLVNRAQTKGRYQVNFDASNLSSGVYFYRIRSGSFVKTMKMILLR